MQTHEGWLHQSKLSPTIAVHPVFSPFNVSKVMPARIEFHYCTTISVMSECDGGGIGEMRQARDI